ncbi:hypothetical protein UT300005_24820 [Clostridium sp. CTA-5]
MSIIKEYVYRKHLREPIKYLLLIMAFVLSIIIDTCIISYIRSTGDNSISYLMIFVITTLIILGVVGVEFLLLYFFVFRKFKNISVQLTDLGIIYKNIKGTTFIQYEEIQSIQFPSIRYIGGWAKIKSNGKNIRLTVVLENIGKFINELKYTLDKKNINYIYDERKLYNFCKTATYSDQSWERVYEKLKTLLITYAICILISIIYLGFMNLYVSQIIFVILIILYPLYVFIISEIILGFRLSIKTKAKGKILTIRDKKVENTIYKYTALILGALILGILIFSII